MMVMIVMVVVCGATVGGCHGEKERDFMLGCFCMLTDIQGTRRDQEVVDDVPRNCLIAAAAAACDILVGNLPVLCFCFIQFVGSLVVLLGKAPGDLFP